MKHLKSSKLDSDSAGELQEKVPADDYTMASENGHMTSNEPSSCGNHLATESMTAPEEDHHKIGNILSYLEFNRATKAITAYICHGLKSAAKGITSIGKKDSVPFHSSREIKIAEIYMRKNIGEDPLRRLNMREAANKIIS
jgi:hypothetical protein